MIGKYFIASDIWLHILYGIGVQPQIGKANFGVPER